MANNKHLIQEIHQDAENIVCALRLLPNSETACLELEVNGHTFDEARNATQKFIIALQERLDNQEKCPFHPKRRNHKEAI